MKMKIYPETGAAYTVIFSDVDNDAPKNENDVDKWINEHAQQVQKYEIISN